MLFTILCLQYTLYNTLFIMTKPTAKMNSGCGPLVYVPVLPPHKYLPHPHSPSCGRVAQEEKCFQVEHNIHAKNLMKMSSLKKLQRTKNNHNDMKRTYTPGTSLHYSLVRKEYSVCVLIPKSDPLFRKIESKNIKIEVKKKTRRLMYEVKTKSKKKEKA